jgi:hypothetical protein
LAPADELGCMSQDVVIEFLYELASGQLARTPGTSPEMFGLDVHDVRAALRREDKLRPLKIA